MPGDGESRKTGLRTLGRLSGGSQALQVADEWPALRSRQLGPDGHSVPNYTVGKDPELDAAQLLRRAQKLDAGLDRSTVYRTLQLRKRHGLIDELDLMHIHGEGHYYERTESGSHPHGLVEKDYRFRIVVSRLEIGGYCAGCSN